MATAYPTLELRQHFVAFLDVLGFSDMVETDLRSEDQAYLSKLFRCHQNAAAIFSDDVNCTITQFSDSIVVAMPYDAARFEWFASKVAEYQRLLLDKGLLCRGGIAVDKHFSNGTFTFSAGLIRAYHVESKFARYPRVVVSNEALSLIYPNFDTTPDFLIKENDGLYFIDYIGLTKSKKTVTLKLALKSAIESLSNSASASVREKGFWLAEYSDAILSTGLSQPRFSGKRIKAN